ncbi:sensor histidine kinase YvfT [Siminovitchia terrae]|uniref:histidine kinase n=1 Tax=Siminovitchia terrae TaxID=1914933 RepID=A0A429XAH9_SIMTE|nr:sensor histidine kinase [Siminovitchia terrae]RST60379.1 sensor histidine kinase [Siminovitchia terrae]GIN90371.1 sensor histidine kinase YvfT [Siminovitchia terrae]GIN96879.1 sensor histidine kinase YvfT [Siminovitchia terrae]
MIRKFTLFPKDQGFTPLIWLCFLLIPLFSMYPYDSLDKVCMTGLIIIFAVCYRNSLFAEKYYPFWISIQYLISFIYLVHLGYVYLFMFPAWQIGFSKLTTKRFNWFYSALLILIMTGSLIVWMKGLRFNNENLIASGAFTLFTLLAPFGGREFLKQQEQRKQMYQANERLESLIVGKERNRIARELHDSLGQSLSVMTIKLDLAQKLFDHDLAVSKKEINEVQQLSRETLTMVREIVSDMRRKTIMEELVEINRVLSAAKVILTTENESVVQGVPLRLQNEVSYCLREAITNIIRHSQATYCKITFLLKEDVFTFSIQDNGIGIKDLKFGNGLVGMRERVEQLNGHLLVADRKGMCLTITIPLEEDHHD